VFAVIADPADGVCPPEIGALAGALSAPAHAGPLRRFPPLPSPGRVKFAAAVRVPGFLAEDRYDAQPLMSEDGRLLFAAQVRLDNRDELIGALGLARDAATTADSDILFAAYRRWGSSVVDHLLGAYAFVAYDFRTDSIFAAVDPMSDYRLYYALRGRRILLCTQLAALAAFDGSTVDPLAVGLAAEARYLPGATPFAGVRRLGGGEVLRWCNGEGATERWWAPDPPMVHYDDPADYVAAAREALRAAVERSLRAVVPVATMLSGGLDSGLVAGFAARALSERGVVISGYTSAPAPGVPVWQRPGWDADDAPFAEAVAAHHENLRHIVLRDEDRTALDLIGTIHERCATPVRNGANHLWLDCIHRAAAPGVLLSGAHGNFSISYTGLGANRERLRTLRWGAALRAARAARTATGKPLWRNLATGIVPEPLIWFVREMGRRPGPADAWMTTADFRQRHNRTLQRNHPPWHTRAGVRYFATRWAHQWAADPLAMRGIEVRDPTADQRLVELLISFPLSAFVQEGRTRGLAREVGRGVLPDSVRLRSTRGMQAAGYAASVARQSDRYRAAIDRIGGSPVGRELFDISALRDALARIERGSRSTEWSTLLDRAVDAGLFLVDRS
jgi:asparagine synthase (glutamine-hydrolysing)